MTLLLLLPSFGFTAAACAAAPAGSPMVSSQPTGICDTAVDTGPTLQIPTRFVHLAGPPFGVTAAAGYALVAAGRRIEVLSDTGATPQLVHTVTLPTALGAGLALSPDGRYLLVADGSGADVVSVAEAERGEKHAVLGALDEPNPNVPGGAIEAAVTSDDRYAFVSLEDDRSIAVYRLGAAVASHFRGSYYVGSIPTGEAPVGLALSPDGRWLYSTSEIDPGHGGQGSLSVIDVAKAERRPAHAVVATTTAGCSPVRVTTSATGDVVWVTARGSDELLGFSAAGLRSDPADARVARVMVGEAPVGLELVDGGAEIVLADSNRFDAAGQSSGLTIVNTAAALAGQPAVVGTIGAELFPREMAIDPDGDRLLVGNFASDTLETVPLQDLAQPQEPGSTRAKFGDR